MHRRLGYYFCFVYLTVFIVYSCQCFPLKGVELYTPALGGVCILNVFVMIRCGVGACPCGYFDQLSSICWLVCAKCSWVSENVKKPSSRFPMMQATDQLSGLDASWVFLN